MANKWAIQNGNWSDGSTWNDGVVPTANDDVYCNGKQINIDANVQNTIIVKSLHNELFDETGNSGGFIYVTNSSINNYFNFVGDLYGDRTTTIIQNSGFQNITGNGFYAKINSGGNTNRCNFIGNLTNCLFTDYTSGSNRYVEITGNIFIGQGFQFVGPSSYTAATFNLTVFGKLEQRDFITSGGNGYPTSITGTWVIYKDIIFNGNMTLNGTLDLTHNGGVLPIPPNRTFNFGRQAQSYVALVTEPDVLQSVVLEGYQYGDKVGTLKTVQGTIIEHATVIEDATVVEEASIVNLTEQQVNRVSQCATKETVDEAFEEFISESATIINKASVITGDATVIKGDVAAVNLTREQIERIKNCATVSTVQRCFSDFKNKK